MPDARGASAGRKPSKGGKAKSRKPAATRRRAPAKGGGRRQAAAAEPKATMNGVLVQRIEGEGGELAVQSQPLGDVKMAELPTLLRRAANDVEKRILD